MEGTAGSTRPSQSHRTQARIVIESLTEARQAALEIVRAVAPHNGTLLARLRMLVERGERVLRDA